MIGILDRGPDRPVTDALSPETRAQRGPMGREAFRHARDAIAAECRRVLGVPEEADRPLSQEEVSVRARELLQKPSKHKPGNAPPTVEQRYEEFRRQEKGEQAVDARRKKAQRRKRWGF
jgi:hypothetical protein